MSDAIPLPPRPKLDQYKNLAKDLQQACKSADADAVRAWAECWLLTLARKLTPKLRRQITHDARRVQYHWDELRKSNERAGACKLADAQFFLARGHGFADWPTFTRHLTGLAKAGSPVSQFESAVDAIVDGDKATLKKLLAMNPELVQVRSLREHRSTLLHYVSANGVEDFRQRTPKNIVAITKLLLDAGADVNAESDAYGGRSTTLGLTATSCHPQDAGVQVPLMELLIDRGAIIDGPDSGSAVNGCLHNGRGEAAEFFASCGARLDLEGAAGVGRLDVVKTFFKSDGTLKPPATQQQLKDGFAWACQFGRTAVVDFFVRQGTKLDATLKHDGQTGLHWAAYGGHADTVKLLLKRGAPVNAKDKFYDGTPLEWALYCWGNSPVRADRGHHYEVVALLVRAGATLDPHWFDDDVERQRALRKLQADPRMQAALRGEMKPGVIAS